MSTHLRIGMGLAVLLVGCLAGGCVQDPTMVGTAEFKQTLAARDKVELGMSEPELRALFPHGDLALSGTDVISGAEVRELRLRAMDAWGGGVVQRYFYFENGVLAFYSDSPAEDYRRGFGLGDAPAWVPGYRSPPH